MNNNCDQMALTNSSLAKTLNNKTIETQPTCPKPSSDQTTRKITPKQVLSKKKAPEVAQRETPNFQKNKNLSDTQRNIPKFVPPQRWEPPKATM